jgi:hypothetical protein
MTLAIEVSQTYRIEKGGGRKAGNAQERAVGLESKLPTEAVNQDSTNFRLWSGLLIAQIR